MINLINAGLGLLKSVTSQADTKPSKQEHAPSQIRDAFVPRSKAENDAEFARNWKAFKAGGKSLNANETRYLQQQQLAWSGAPHRGGPPAEDALKTLSPETENSLRKSLPAPDSATQFGSLA